MLEPTTDLQEVMSSSSGMSKQLTIQQALGNALSEADRGNAGRCFAQALHKPAIVEGPPRHITIKALCRVSHLCLLPVLEHAVPIDLRRAQAEGPQMLLQLRSHSKHTEFMDLERLKKGNQPLPRPVHV